MISETQLTILQREIKLIMVALKDTFPRKSGQREDCAWKFPKMHKLLELGYNVYKWGQLLNTSCQTGERAHTSITKKAYLKTNYKNAQKQMVERYLRRAGSARRAENLAAFLSVNPGHRLHWEGLDPRWRKTRQLYASKAQRVRKPIGSRN